MDKQFFFLSPIEAVKVTSLNLAEVAEWCGGEVSSVESTKVKGRMDSYVWVPTPKGTAISWAFPGMYVTKRLVVSTKGVLKTTWAVFRRDYFDKNYFDTPTDAVNATWERENREQKIKKPKPKGPDTTTVINVTVAPGRAVDPQEIAKSVQMAMRDKA